MKYLIVLLLIAITIFLGLRNQTYVNIDPVLAEYKTEFAQAEEKRVANEQRMAREKQKSELIQSIASTYREGEESVRIQIVRTFLPFGVDNAKMALYIAKNESGFRLNAKGWNCEYEFAGVKKSTACKIQDRHKAWSVDCGLFQINIAGQECPEEMMQLEKNLAAAVGKFVGRDNTWWAWVAYHNLFK